MAKKKKNYYFTQETQDAIVEYINCDNSIKKNKIYKEKINFAFFKLTQNIINTYKFPYLDGSVEDQQQECICHLLENMGKYNPDKGKAYSYFGTAVLRYCINQNKKLYKKTIERSEVSDVDENRSTILESEFDNSEIHNTLFNEENYVLRKFTEYVNIHFEDICDDEDEKLICMSVIDIIEDIDKIEILAKKAIFLYLRESTKKDTIEITKFLKKLKTIYFRLKKQYIKFGFISLNF